MAAEEMESEASYIADDTEQLENAASDVAGIINTSRSEKDFQNGVEKLYDDHHDVIADNGIQAVFDKVDSSKSRGIENFIQKQFDHIEDAYNEVADQQQASPD